LRERWRTFAADDRDPRVDTVASPQEQQPRPPYAFEPALDLCRPGLFTSGASALAASLSADSAPALDADGTTKVAPEAGSANAGHRCK